MAELIYENEKKIVEDGKSIKEACQEFGVPFGCNEGLCGTCAIDILEGAENLNELNEKEKAFGFDRSKRLCCQAKIMKGSVTFDF